VWLTDTEFTARDGERPIPVCLCAFELISGATVQLWQDQLGPVPPIPTDRSSLMVCYAANAELAFFDVLGWRLPDAVLDLYVEFLACTNGLTLATDPDRHRGLLDALLHFGITGITKEEKHEGRSPVIRGGPFTEEERRSTLEYCMSDARVLGPLLVHMVPKILATRQGLARALTRGRYMGAIARIENTGVPVDVPTFELIRDRHHMIKDELITKIDTNYGVYEKGVFKQGRFAQLLDSMNVTWPRTATGRLSMEADTWRDMARAHPQLEDLRQLYHFVEHFEPAKLAVGADGRNRVSLMPFRSITGRNQPSSNRFIFGPSAWLRGLIKPAPGHRLAYIDWSSQEIVIAAVLSGDEALLEGIHSGDVYMWFARRTGQVPADATKESHPDTRAVVKTMLLGMGYGMGWRRLSIQAGIGELEAKDLLRRQAVTFPAFTAWSDNEVHLAQLARWTSTVYGWPLAVSATSKSTTLRNFPCQANGAEMLRLACIFAIEADLTVCAPIHDALLVEATDDDFFATVTATREVMSEASRKVLAGEVVPTEVTEVAWPDRYMDPRDKNMWHTVMSLLGSGVAGVHRVAGVAGVQGVPNLFPPLALPSNLIHDGQIRNQEELSPNGDDPCGTREVSFLEGAS
jgi:hypothetical protein